MSAKLRPLLLRRLKKHVAKDLPDRIEQRRDCELGEEQRKLYLAELRRSREQVMKTVAEKGLNKSKMHVLAALTRLRQICCHPQLVGNDCVSGKTETLFELLDSLVAEGQKVLVFSQFVQMLQLLEAECRQRQIPTHILTGQTKDRQEVVSAFQNDPNAAVFLLSLRAAGTGLNLTTASYVVLYDPWWNPAVEAQAIDRSHRIGQTQTVNAYRLISPGTVEEKIWELQQSKAQTIADVLGRGRLRPQPVQGRSGIPVCGGLIWPTPVRPRFAPGGSAVTVGRRVTVGLTAFAGSASSQTMARQISRRGFVKSSLIASAAVPLGLRGQTRPPRAPPRPPALRPPQRRKCRLGKMGGQEFSRLMLGGNLIGGWSHSRDLAYVVHPDAPLQHRRQDPRDARNRPRPTASPPSTPGSCRRTRTCSTTGSAAAK